MSLPINEVVVNPGREYEICEHGTTYCQCVLFRNWLKYENRMAAEAALMEYCTGKKEGFTLVVQGTF